MGLNVDGTVVRPGSRSKVLFTRQGVSRAGLGSGQTWHEKGSEQGWAQIWGNLESYAVALAIG